MASVLTDEKRAEWKQNGLALLMQDFGGNKYAQKLAAIMDRVEEAAFRACSSNPAMYEVDLRKRLDKCKEGITKMLQQQAARSAMAQQQQEHQQMQQPVPMVNQQPMMQVPQDMVPQPQPQQQEGHMPQPASTAAPGALGAQAGASAPAALPTPRGDAPSIPAALAHEYMALVGQLRPRQGFLRAEIDKLSKLDCQRAKRAHSLLLEAYTHCTVEPGSAAAASCRISDNTVKLLRSVMSSLKRRATAAKAPTPAATNSAAGDGVDGAESAPSLFICPITQEVMEDPVVAADGHTYERKLIEKWMQRAQASGSAAGPSSSAPRSPMTNQPLPNTVLVPILALRSAIREWQEQQQRLRL
ncbi:hypothetical protein HXX76_002037 [Chlamydomonas incerta]|uniref:U-box domain-containing protein n=1 Tax=Chlamydomonas incerta TaxID=51695 RepID=A0A835WAB4_CHLIN|nr:hypothetical protein HXX76_002037 [Chlamydomonas incerta]|eukprot:KAG2443689.1 hypothetical protein HXX76_002037 [Chlamydomonas incerta]